jgi:hypothetical protein
VKDQIKFGGNIVDTSKQKPDLMGTSRSQPDGAKRILAHLEHGARLPASKPGRGAAWTLDGWTLGLGMLLLAMCGIAWLMHERAAAPSGYKAGYNSVRTSSRHESKYKAMQAKAQLETAQAAPVEVIVEPAELPAAIVNDPASLQAQNKSEMQPAATGVVVATSTAPPAPRANTPTPTPAPVTSTAATTHAVAKNSTSDNPSAGATTARSPVAVAAASRGKVAAAPNDTDVALLAALVAHAGKPSVVAPERSRDIVERQEGDSTADLLARCKQLGLIEGMLCRSRICSGRWDSDATCRAPAH